jgi:hypothetical protein
MPRIGYAVILPEVDELTASLAVPVVALSRRPLIVSQKIPPKKEGSRDYLICLTRGLTLKMVYRLRAVRPISNIITASMPFIL